MCNSVTCTCHKGKQSSQPLLYVLHENVATNIQTWK